MISVLANALPEAFYSLCHEEEALAQKALFSLLELNPLMYRESNPVGLKALLSLMGICGPDVRLPLLEATDELKDAIRAALKKR
nr:dihydrodipicolinate synthase family protein [Nitritalea halalkaliphila]